VTDTKAIRYALLAIVAWMVWDVFMDLDQWRQPAERPSEFTEQDVFCAEFIRMNADYANQYTDRELLRICKVYRETGDGGY